MTNDKIPATWPKDAAADLIRPPAAAQILGLSRERTSALARPVSWRGGTVPGYLVPDQAFPGDAGVVRFFRRDYVEAIAVLRKAFDPEDPRRGARPWAAWVEDQVGRDRTPWFQFYGLTMSRD